MSKKTFFHNKKITRILGASSLAIMMGVGTLCGVLLTASGCATTAQVSNVENINTTISNQSGVSPLGLDPKNDPVIARTESGLEIKQSNALVNTGLSSMFYITMGTYGGKAINWIFIGLPSTLFGASTASIQASGMFERTSPAGSSINSQNWWHYMLTSNKIPVASELKVFNSALLIAEPCFTNNTMFQLGKFSLSYNYSTGVGDLEIPSLSGNAGTHPWDFAFTVENNYKKAPITNNIQSSLNTLYSNFTFSSAEKAIITTDSSAGNGSNVFFAPTATQAGRLSTKLAYIYSATNTNSPQNWAIRATPTFSNFSYTYNSLNSNTANRGSIYVNIQHASNANSLVTTQFGSVSCSQRDCGAYEESTTEHFIAMATYTTSGSMNLYSRPCMVIKLNSFCKR